MVKKSPSINLLKSKEETFIDRFITWALTIGRIVVILTELIALGAFLYRFSLDRQIIDLHTKIKQEQTVVGYLKENEGVFRNLQNRLFIASSFANSSKKDVAILDDIINFGSDNVIFNTIALQEDGVRINVSFRSVNSLQQFVTSLKNYKSVDSVSIDKIENRSSSGTITIGITAVFKKEKNGITN